MVDGLATLSDWLVPLSAPDLTDTARSFSWIEGAIFFVGTFAVFATHAILILLRYEDSC